jgi:poly(A) polymerase
MTRKLDSAHVEWMREEHVVRLMAVLAKDGGDARFVGGAVRDTLLGLPVTDVDIATPIEPNDVVRRLQAAHFGAVPTGIDHGTITAVVDGRTYEVTTLRRDVATDGRHAVVAFTKDWRQDAARRDFTINAFYASANGEIFDYHNGLADLDAGRVRFIGDATQRIREDCLRILRLFRFHAWYGKGEIDQGALNAAAVERTGLAKLSGERIRQELLRLLEAESPIAVLRIMAATGILAEILPGALDIVRLEHLCVIDAANFFVPDAILRLAALLPNDMVATAADRLALSNRDRARLEYLVADTEKIVPYLSVREVRKLLYRLGSARFKDLVFLRWAEDLKPSNAIQWRALLALSDAWERPAFPLTGRHAMLAGVPQGPLVGRVLAEVEQWWIDSDFAEDEFSLAERLKAVVQATAY